ncbi:hypothetical protein RRG08_011783 [Elysia crispata]|uniref:Uncharacterized protein n=1 Tax=Elysia crispata TaxID=231223 RepID=A0AAE1A2X9_9GAST|nr:hypothetical protein RRG08_011783 [Elysia crispata]
MTLAEVTRMARINYFFPIPLLTDFGVSNTQFTRLDFLRNFGFSPQFELHVCKENVFLAPWVPSEHLTEIAFEDNACENSGSGLCNTAYQLTDRS